MTRDPGLRLFAHHLRRWQSIEGPGVTFEERIEQLVTCEGCAGRGPLAAQDGAAQENEALVLRIEQLVCEQQAGRRFEPAELDDLEWRGLVEWHRHEDGYRRVHEVRIKKMLELMMAQINARK